MHRYQTAVLSDNFCHGRAIAEPGSIKDVHEEVLQFIQVIKENKSDNETLTEVDISVIAGHLVDI